MLKLMIYINCKKLTTFKKAILIKRLFKVSIRMRTRKICFTIKNGLRRRHGIVLRLFNLIFVFQFPMTYLTQKARNFMMLISRDPGLKKTRFFLFLFF